MNLQTIDTTVRPTPVDVEKTQALGGVLARSGYFAEAKDAAQAAVKILAGQELGIGPIAAMMHIFFIKGRIALSAGLIAALILRSGRYSYSIKHHDDQRCVVEITQDGASIGVSSFTLEDARKAGLAAGDNYRKYPRNMLFARAISNAARWFCADVFYGAIYTPEELDPDAPLDVEVVPASVTVSPTAEPVLPEATAKPKAKSKAKAKAEPPASPLTAQPEAAKSEHDQVSHLVGETGTDVVKFLAHYRIPAIEQLTPEQCAEAIAVLTSRLSSADPF